MGVEGLGMEVMERVAYNIRRPDQGINDRSRGVKILKVWRLRKFRQDVYMYYLTSTVVFGVEVVEGVAR